MNAEQILLVKKTWKLFRDINPGVLGDAFYTKLFTENPQLRKMFPGEMTLQYKKLMDMLSTIVARLDKIGELSEDIAAMARRHETYGVKPVHYTIVGDALIWTIQQGLGKDWTAEVSNAWHSCYRVLSETMIAATQRQADQQ